MTQPAPPTPFAWLGGRDAVLALAEDFYAIMARTEPELTALHRRDESGAVDPEVRARFGLFLVGWLGGPQDYVAAHGHPRLRMRHARVPVDERMRDAWLRAMSAALDQHGVQGEPRRFLDARFAQLADHMRNQS
jgi:hemoglobin